MRDLIQSPELKPSIHGNVNIGLYERGRLVQSVRHENYVSPRWLAAISKMAQYGVVGLNHQGSTSTNITTGGWWNTNYGPFRMAPFTGLQLTDYASPVDELEECVHGTTLAEGAYPYTSSSGNRGTFNPGESYQHADSFRFVYDFATTQANGTFQSIYTLPINDTDNISGFMIVGIPTFNTVYKIQFNACAYSGGNLYALDNSNNFRIIPLSLYMDWSNGYGTAIPGATSLTPSPAGLTIKDGRLYWITAASGSQTINSAPLTDLGNVTTHVTLDSAWRTQYGSFNRIVYAAGRDSFMLGSTNVSSGKPSIVELDASLDATPIHTFVENSNFAFPMFVVSPHDPTIISYGRTWDLDDNNGTITATATAIANANATYANAAAATNIGDMLLMWNYSSSQYLTPQQYYFSRARLDDPVTKTSQQTMKITYDFTMDPIDWDDEAGS